MIYYYKMQQLYNIYIYERYRDLKNSQKQIYDNNDLCKIFEYYTAINLSQKYYETFYEYNDIDPTFKEDNQLSKNDTGIDLCNMNNTIVQCKLRNSTLNWGEVGTFFASAISYSPILKTNVIRWTILMVARNDDCKLSSNLLNKANLFVDTIYNKDTMIEYCEKLIINPPTYPEYIKNHIKLRDYQIEAIDLIHNSKNIVICLPTGSGKNLVIINSFEYGYKYLILVPRIILMEQLYDEIIKHNKQLKNFIQLIGDGNSDFNEKYLITICVFNSVKIVEPYHYLFHKIYVDEAHHIHKPEIYKFCDDTQDNICESLQDEDIINETDDNNSDINEYEESNIDNDIEDELDKTNNYLSIIDSLKKYHNNVYLSATIDEIEGFNFYRKDIRFMIDANYLCDYTLHIPIFTKDPEYKHIASYLLKNYRNVIVYCHTRNEGKKFNDILNSIQSNTSAYIDCHTPKSKRNMILNNYKNGLLPFLINVRVLVEGFDAPITKGICFIDLPSNGTTIIQIIGRALRNHPLKTIANIILPCTSNENVDNINKFMKIIGNNDSRIYQSLKNKNLGGYINIITSNLNIENDNDISFCYEMIYNNMGILTDPDQIWEYKFEQVKNYINKYKQLPPFQRTNKVLTALARWIQYQRDSYIKKNFLMKKTYYYDKWTNFMLQYNEYFINKEDLWKSTYSDFKEYVIVFGKAPSKESADIHEKKLCNWLHNQRKLHTHGKLHGTHRSVMQNDELRIMWENLYYSPEFYNIIATDNDIWDDKYNEYKKYLNIEGKLPRHKSNKLLYLWGNTQTKNYINKSMKHDLYYKLWDNLMDTYNIRNEMLTSKSMEDKWNHQFDMASDYDNLTVEEQKVTNKWICLQHKKYLKEKARFAEKNIVIYGLILIFITNIKY